jgi:hypothetical protein
MQKARETEPDYSKDYSKGRWVGIAVKWQVLEILGQYQKQKSFDLNYYF